MRIQVNGEGKEVDDDSSLASLIDGLNLKAERLAVELNQQVVRSADWETTQLHVDDRVEIVHFVGGGDARI